MPDSEARYGRRRRMVLRGGFSYENEIVGCEWSLLLLRRRRITFDYYLATKPEGDPPVQVTIHFDLRDFETRWRGAHSSNQEGYAKLDGACITVRPAFFGGERMTTIKGPLDPTPHVLPCSIIEQALRWHPPYALIVTAVSTTITAAATTVLAFLSVVGFFD